MATIPSLALIPSGYKASKVYSVLPTDGTGDFDFTRSGNATRVNSEGLIELVSTNVPRLNYPLIDGVVQGCPSLLLEPQRINLLIYSEDFSNPAWNKINSTINSNQTISPKGDLTADLLSATTTTGSYFIDVLFVTPAQKYTYSIFAKKSNSDYFAFIIVDGANVIRQYYNVSDGTVGITNNSGSPIVENIKIENYGNGWYRCSLTIQALNSAVEVRNYVIQNDGIATAPIGSEIFLWGIQSEQGSYATSYIPTSGTIGTRSAETCNNAGDVNTFNDSEGVLFAEINQLQTSSGSYFGISVDTSNRLIIGVEGGGAKVYRNSNLVANNMVSDNLQFNKVAVKYTSTSTETYVNGFLHTNSATAPAITGLNTLKFDSGAGGQDFYGNTKQIQYFDSALNDSDLETLTSWDSFSDMATSQLYTIE